MKTKSARISWRRNAAVHRHIAFGPADNGKQPSKQSLWHRIRYHYRGNAEGSTLRLTLGCLLADHLGIQLRRVGGGKRMTFGQGEAALSDWISQNALVEFHVCDKPWELEAKLLETASRLSCEAYRTAQGDETTSPHHGRASLMPTPVGPP